MLQASSNCPPSYLVVEYFFAESACEAMVPVVSQLLLFFLLQFINVTQHVLGAGYFVALWTRLLNIQNLDNTIIQQHAVTNSTQPMAFNVLQQACAADRWVHVTYKALYAMHAQRRV